MIKILRCALMFFLACLHCAARRRGARMVTTWDRDSIERVEPGAALGSVRFLPPSARAQVK